MNAEKTPPHSLEAEQSLLGALLLDNQAWERVADLVSPRDFYKGNHRVIYEHIELVLASDQPADVVTVAQSMQEAGILEQAGGPAYLGKMAENTPSALNIRRYAEIVREKAIQRGVVRIGGEMVERGLNPGVQSVGELLDEAESKLFALSERRLTRQARTFNQILTKVFESIDHRYHSDKREITGIATGFKKLDMMTAGLQPGDFVVVAGRPSMGKTALAMNVAEHVGLALKLPVAIFSIEMTDEQLAQRMLGSVGRVDQHKLRTGMLDNEDWDRLARAMESLHDSPFIIEETVSLSIIELRARARRLKRENPKLGLIVVDYMGLMASKAQTQSERTQEISEISRGMKALAKELNLPVMGLSQLNRGVEARINKRPMMSDLRDSGSIEQDADLVVMMYRDEYYNENSAAAGYAEAIVGKQRNGATGTVYLQFIKEETRFQDTDWRPPRKEKKQKKGFVVDAEESASTKAEAEAAQ